MSKQAEALLFLDNVLGHLQDIGEVQLHRPNGSACKSLVSGLDEMKNIFMRLKLNSLFLHQL
jgi:hypothetical protein